MEFITDEGNLIKTCGQIGYCGVKPKYDGVKLDLSSGLPLGYMTNEIREILNNPSNFFIAKFLEGNNSKRYDLAVEIGGSLYEDRESLIVPYGLSGDVIENIGYCTFFNMRNFQARSLQLNGFFFDKGITQLVNKILSEGGCEFKSDLISLQLPEQ